jgi:hypothetical protein
MTLFPKVESWIFGANIPGKKKTVCSTWRAWRPPPAARGRQKRRLQRVRLQLSDVPAPERRAFALTARHV